MAESVIEAVNFWDNFPPAEMAGATVVSGRAGGQLIVLITYIGSSVFHITEQCTRRYDLSGQQQVGPYILTIIKRLKESHTTSYVISFFEHPGGDLRSAENNASRFARCPGFPAVWANAPWGQTNILDPVKELAVMGRPAPDDDAKQLLNMLSGQAVPATDPVPPPPRVSDNATPDRSIPHRRSVLKGMRDPASYIRSLRA